MSNSAILAFVARLDLIVTACWRYAASAVILLLAACAIVMLWPDTRRE